jgi:hypothetical protein
MALTNAYATLNELKAATRISDNVDDSLLEMAIESASRAIDSYTNRNFYSSGTATRYYAPQNSYICETDDIISLSTLTTLDADDNYTVAWAAKDYQLEPLNGFVDGFSVPYTRIRAIDDYVFETLGGQATVKVVGVFGYATAVPMSIKQATIIQASRIYKRLDSPLGVAGFGDLGVVRVGSKLDPDVAQLVDSFRRIRMA